MIDLLLATGNTGKFREYSSLFDVLPLRLLSLRDLALKLDVYESGRTFAENAALKAVAYARSSGLLTVADDSGLEVDALHGEPGVHSARYGAPQATDDAARVQLLLDNIRDVPWAARTARFRCVIAVTRPEGHVFLAEGECGGHIAMSPRGTDGFGYDPIFYLVDHRRTMAQLTSNEKNKISHRARAGAAARSILLRLSGQ